jgi:hypothetical protein
MYDLADAMNEFVNLIWLDVIDDIYPKRRSTDEKKWYWADRQYGGLSLRLGFFAYYNGSGLLLMLFFKLQTQRWQTQFQWGGNSQNQNSQQAITRHSYSVDFIKPVNDETAFWQDFLFLKMLKCPT